jgi:hypothetical protein
MTIFDTTLFSPLLKKELDTSYSFMRHCRSRIEIAQESKMQHELKHSVINAGLGVAAEVYTHNLGFLVKLKDTDADLYFPEMVIVPTLESAVKAANKAVSNFEVAA